MTEHAATAGLELRMGFETEWVVARAPRGTRPPPARTNRSTTPARAPRTA